MQPNIKWLDDPRVFRVGQLDAHSDHLYYDSEESSRNGEMTLSQSLDGVWKFAYSVNAKERPAQFYTEGYDLSAFDEITVPGHIEMAGYDSIHYINTMYPWEGHMYRRPAYSLPNAGDGQGMFSEAEYNPVGSYIREFELQESMQVWSSVVSLEELSDTSGRKSSFQDSRNLPKKKQYHKKASYFITSFLYFF